MIIDAFVQNHWSSVTELADYIAPAWRECLGYPNSLKVRFISRPLYSNPLGEFAPELNSTEGPPGCRPDQILTDLTQGGRVQRVVLSPREGQLASSSPNHYLARAAVRAVNDWLMERWLGHESGAFYGLVLVSPHLPDEAAKEIRRVGRSPRIVGVLLGTNSLGRPFGHPLFHPIYKAAADQGLPIVIQTGQDPAAADLTVPPLAGGYPATFGEYRALASETVIFHLSSLIGQGVFELFPSLKVLIVGAGVGWLPAFLWRFDSNFKAHVREAPWLVQLPSDYVRQNVRLCTYSFDLATPAEALAQELGAVEDIEKLLVFGSGYPKWDMQDAGACEARLPAQWRSDVLSANAAHLFRWPDAPS